MFVLCGGSCNLVLAKLVSAVQSCILLNNEIDDTKLYVCIDSAMSTLSPRVSSIFNSLELVSWLSTGKAHFFR